jgi:prepilin-type N-terminal cleavage/methylation domain-containing protein
MNSRRGVTLIEVLVALSMLTLILIVSVSWMTSILKKQSTMSSDANWRRASSRLLETIEHDILTVDQLVIGSQRGVPRIEVLEGSIRIRSRDDSGIGTFVYALNSQSGELIRHRANERAGFDTVPVLGSVQTFNCSIEGPTADRVTPVLSVALISDTGLQVSRTITLRREDVQ